jgi:8-oxo-dGTP pyrophosphatase MutT (NUDIX family)
MANDKGTSDRSQGQVAALPWRRGEAVEILLISSRETRRWVIPKGWPMKGLSGPKSAEREAFEEAGVEGAIADKPIGTYTYAKRARSGAIQTLSVEVFPMLVETERKNWPERNERVRRWASVDDAAAAVDEPELKQIIVAFGAARARKATVRA